MNSDPLIIEGEAEIRRAIRRAVWRTTELPHWLLANLRTGISQHIRTLGGSVQLKYYDSIL
jgi:hypothetical protein